MQNIEFWKNVAFQPEGYTGLTCPNCSTGKLFIPEGACSKHDTNASWDHQENRGMWPDDRVQLFSVILKCNNCGDGVACLGHVFYDMKLNFKLTYEHYDRHEYCEPIYFHPPLKIIDIKPSYPEEIQKELISSFSHFFADLSACANKIRASVEALLNKQKVNKIRITPPKKGKQRRQVRISLHERIKLFESKNKDIADHLLAIKWIGNSGSHNDSSKLTKEDVLDAYRLLDYCLNKLYNDPTKEIRKLSKIINKHKGPLPKRAGTK